MKTKRIKFCLLFGLAMTVGVLTSCTHSLEIKNLDKYRSMSIQSMKRPVSIGIIPLIEPIVTTPKSTENSESDVYCQRLLKAIGTALTKYGEVILPYSQSQDKKVDVIAQMDIKSEYKGSFWNFFPIEFPGFIFFIPSINGYVYKVNYDVSVSLTETLENKFINSISVPVHLDVRHASLGRTWSTGFGWLVTWVLPIFSGIVHTRYNEDVSPLVMDRIEQPVGEYIAQEIISKINAYKLTGIQQKPSQPQTQIEPSSTSSTRDLPSGPPLLGPKMKDYYSMLWPKIKEKWQLKNLPKGEAALEATIVIVIGREGDVQQAWFEKKSGNDLYDEEGMKAIKKAEPFPPLPMELGNDTLKVGVRFYPD